YIEAYFLRFRRLVCGLFYPKREKQRILYLYNDRLKKRKNYVRYLVHRLKKLVQEKSLSVDRGLLVSLAQHWSYFRFLRLFSCAKRCCIVCDEKENPTFVSCSNTDCDLIYCEQCWKAVNRKCYGCLPIESDGTDLSDDDV
ncbi:DC-STAMP domain-containing protein 1-like protein, partial [Leptotrombidium deliense]